MRAQTVNSKWTSGRGTDRVVDHTQKPNKQADPGHGTGGKDNRVEYRRATQGVKSGPAFEYTGRGFPIRVPTTWKEEAHYRLELARWYRARFAYWVSERLSEFFN